MKALGKRILLLLAGLGAAACSHDKPPEPNNNFANYGGGTYGPSYGAYDAGSTATPPVTATADAAAAPDLNNLVTGALAQGAALLGAMGGGTDAVDIGIKSLAQQQAPGMKPDGAVIKTTLAPGAHGEGTVTLRPGKCYTIVAFGNLGVQQLAIRLVPPAPLPPQPLFEGTTNGPTATIGAKDQCIRSPSPVATPLKVDIEMKQGQGQVGVQAYSK
jgi:hypothetical protein